MKHGLIVGIIFSTLIHAFIYIQYMDTSKNVAQAAQVADTTQTTDTQQQVLTGTNGTATGTTTAINPATMLPNLTPEQESKLLELNKAKKQAAKDYAAAIANDADDATQAKLLQASLQARKNVDEFLNGVRKEAILKEREEAASRRRSHFDSLVEVVCETWKSHLAIQENKKATIEEKNKLYEAWKEAVNNLYSNFTTTVVPQGMTGKGLVKIATSGDGAVGSKTKDIIDIYLQMNPNNEPQAEKEARRFLINEKGFNDGTVGNTIVRYKKENGLM